MSNVNATKTETTRSAAASAARASDTPQDGRDFDVHKHAMRANEQAALDRSYDGGALSEIYEDAAVGDVDDIENAANNGGFKQKRGARGGGDVSDDMAVKRKRPERPSEADPREQSAGGPESKHVQRKQGDLSSSERISAANRVGRTETASLAERQEALVAKLVTQPDDYRGLSAANTETTFDAVQSIEKMIGRSTHWMRSPDATGASMKDQIAKASGAEA